MPLVYTVVATFADESTRTEFIAWLKDDHIAAVVRGGAASGHVVRVTDPAGPPQVEVWYEFPTREAFERYVSTTAPALREEGLKRFPPGRGVTFQRRVGEVV
jgi:hypothetical protein